MSDYTLEVALDMAQQLQDDATDSYETYTALNGETYTDLDGSIM